MKSSSKFFLLLSSLIIGLFVWSHFAKVDITFKAPGHIETQSNSTTIDTMVDGQIETVSIREGDIVKKGDTVVVINPGVGYEKYNVVANVHGRVQSLNYKNPGAVVEKGEPILTIVPEDQKMVVMGKLSVSDRGYVKKGNIAKIKLANQDQIRFGPITGIISNISPDVVYTEAGTYYAIEIALEAQKFSNGVDDYILLPGIMVEVYILTGERTVLSYITSPFHNSLGQALQER
jgi:multidrug efflux pump subunit AcrA (membrane-fusion protein)